MLFLLDMKGYHSVILQKKKQMKKIQRKLMCISPNEKSTILIGMSFSYLFALTSPSVSNWKGFTSDGILKLNMKLGFSYITVKL